MNRRTTLAIAALLATSAIPVAVAQANIDTAANPIYVAEPVASVSKSEGLEGQLATSIAESLAADASLSGSKITVQPVEDGVIVLSGVAPSRAKAKRALEIAAQQAGEGTVVSAIQAEGI
jgi:osmotically-inducible protein OsmY